MKPHKGPATADESCATAAASVPASDPASAARADDLQTLLQRPLPPPGISASAAASSGVRIGHVVQVGGVAPGDGMEEEGGMAPGDGVAPGDGMAEEGEAAAAGDSARPGGLLVLLPGDAEPMPALALCPLTADDVGRPCAVLFVDGDARRPLVVGCIVAGVPVGAGDTVTPESDVSAQHVALEVNEPVFQDKHEVVVDGEVVRLEAQRELELRCGESVILLQSNGRIEIRGNYVTSQATATQRLRGGSVHIN